MNKLLIFLVLTIKLLASDDLVVCIHGFMGGPWCMQLFERDLKKEGFEVVNWGYPSRENYIEEHGKALCQELILLAEENPGKPIHFVTHSMGGIVLLAALNNPDVPIEAKTGRIVMIAPPLHGSIWARWLSQFPIARHIAKEFSGKELMTTNNFFELFGEFPNSLEKILIISGNLGFNPFISGANDGTISISETLPSIPHEHIVVKRGHKTIVFSKKVSTNVVCFLKQT